MIHWPCSFGACGKAVHHGGEHVVEQSCSPHGWEVKEEEGFHYPFQGHTPSDLTSPARPRPLKFPSPPNSAKVWTKPLTHGPLGRRTVQTQTPARTIAAHPRVTKPRTVAPLGQ